MSSTEYDFIIVGGGTSGLVVAARLSQDPNIHVLVLEAGDDHSSDPRVLTPALWPSLLGTEADWGYLSEPQVNFQSLIYAYHSNLTLARML
jgi:choline dehydrogenase-like flavoprotein